MLATVLLALAGLVVFYILIGYPLLLAWAPGRTAPPIRKNPAFRPTVSVLLAVHNGAAFIRPKLECLLALDYPPELLRILVVSDGSTDGTDEIVAAFASPPNRPPIRLLRITRAGKAAALNAALAEATGEILFFTDVRQDLDPQSLANLAANFADPTVGAVTGELRFLDPARHGQQADMELYWRYELWVRRRHSRIDSIFTTTGCIYALRRCLALPLRPDTLTDDATLALAAFFRGYRVIFDPQAVAYDYPTAEGGEFRRRLRTLAGLWQLHFRLPQLFTRANRMRFHFLSYKSTRLLLPWAVLLAWIATLALPPSYTRTFLLIDELALVVLALIDPLVPKGFFLKRVSSPAKTFLAMNAAAMLSVIVFFVSPESLWKPTRVRHTAPR